MTPRNMNLDRFRELLAAYGTHFERWPADERTSAREFLLSSPEARAAFDEEGALDTLLDAAQAPPLTSQLAAQLARIPLQASQGLPFKRRALWMPALGWAAAAVLGVWAGAQFSYEDEPATAAVAQSSEAATNGADDDSQLVALATGEIGALDADLEAP